ncbi:hypothetical protein E0Z10_g5572 [Xylaria hypoxylon]|uniref:CFEM domain-containing protein n=1 Tax=Xylaria hypoxylon TaxID=37992 RepID=A0A4Z0YGP6_9PEZI|nr:hypothetical protein E0Z10_g5572 [Xylaria hypoxylon]
MKYTVAALAFAAAAVSAQSLSDIPECAVPCIDDARTKGTNCAVDDYKCICSNIEALTAAATPCVLSACGAEIALNDLLPAVQTFCDAVNNGGGETPAPTSETTSEPTSESTVEPTEYPTEVSSSSSVSAPVTTESSSSEPTLAPTFGGGNATATTSSSPLIPTAGAAIAGSIGGFAMVALGALAAF